MMVSSDSLIEADENVQPGSTADRAKPWTGEHRKRPWPRNSLNSQNVLHLILETAHLQRVAANHKITIGKKNPTISDLNDPLKNKGVYDTPVWRKIQLLADIRNICSQQKSMEPTEEQVDELISGINSVIKSVF